MSTFMCEECNASHSSVFDSFLKQTWSVKIEHLMMILREFNPSDDNGTRIDPLFSMYVSPLMDADNEVEIDEIREDFKKEVKKFR